MLKSLAWVGVVVGLAGPLVAENAAADPALIAKGEKIFRKCKACHQIGPAAKNRTGPALTGILGAQAGQGAGFRYSKQMVQAGEDGLVWTPETLADFLVSPMGYIKGTRMMFPGLRKPAEVQAIIAYLGSHAG